MNVTQPYGESQAATARTLVGGDVIGDVRNTLLKQILVAVANKTGGVGTGDVVGPASSVTGHVAIFANTSGKLLADGGAGAFLDSAQTFTAANIFSANGAASTPAVSLIGSTFTGGTSTTTKPQFLIEPAGTTSTGWSTDGTMFGVNAPSGFAGNLLSLQKNGSSRAKIASDGSLTLGVSGSGEFPFISLIGSDRSASWVFSAYADGWSTNGASLDMTGSKLRFASSNYGTIYGFQYGIASGHLGIIADSGGATLSICGSTDVTNYERLTFATAAGDYSIFPAAGGTGTLRGLQIGTSAGKLGFFGVSAISCAVLATGAGASVDNVITALQNLGLVKQS